MTGFPNGPPIRTFFPLTDRITALHAAIGALAALREREISGEGQAIDVSLADTGFTVNEIPITAYPADGTIQQREGNGRGPVNAYPTADAGYICWPATRQRGSGSACPGEARVAGGPSLRQTGRAEKHTDELEAALVEWFSARKTAEVVEHLSQYRVPAAPINTVEQAASDPHLHQRETLWRSRTPWRDASTCRGKWSSSARRRWW